jgi:hypothetical protein
VLSDRIGAFVRCPYAVSLSVRGSVVRAAMMPGVVGVMVAQMVVCLIGAGRGTHDDYADALGEHAVSCAFSGGADDGNRTRTVSLGTGLSPTLSP